MTDMISIQEVWNACGGNPEIKPTKEELLITLEYLDKATDIIDTCELIPKELLDSFPEINHYNYDYDDICELNSWGIQVVTANK